MKNTLIPFPSNVNFRIFHLVYAVPMEGQFASFIAYFIGATAGEIYPIVLGQTTALWKEDCGKERILVY